MMSDRLAKPLYDYQRDALDRVHAEFGKGNHGVVLSATMGAGKTVMAADVMAEAREAGKRCWFVVDTTNLAHQTMERFAEYGLSSGLLQAANDRDVSEPILVCSLQTLERRDYARIGGKLECDDQCVKSCDGKVCNALYNEEFDLNRAWLPDLLVVDECHRAWRYWRRVGRAVVANGGRQLGLSGTPYAPFMSRQFDALVNAKTMERLTNEDQVLVPFRMWQAREAVYDMRTAAGKPISPKRGGQPVDFTNTQIDNALNVKVLGDIPRDWWDLTADLREEIGAPPKTLIIVPRVEVGEQLVPMFRERVGVEAAVVSHKDGTEGTPETQKTLARFDDGAVPVLISCAKLTQGFDRPSLRVLMIARPSNDPIPFLQAFGRPLRRDRSDPTKTEARIYDLAGNVDRLGDALNAHYFDGPIGFATHKPSEEGKGEAGPRVCPACDYALMGYPEECPECGLDLTKVVVIEEADASFVEVPFGLEVDEREQWKSEYGIDDELLDKVLFDHEWLFRTVLAHCARELRFSPKQLVYTRALHQFALAGTPKDHIGCRWQGNGACRVSPTTPNCAVKPDERMAREIFYEHRKLKQERMPDDLLSLITAKGAARMALLAFRTDPNLPLPPTIRCKCCKRFIPVRNMKSKNNKYGLYGTCGQCRADRERANYRRHWCAWCMKCALGTPGAEVFPAAMTATLDGIVCGACKPW